MNYFNMLGKSSVVALLLSTSALASVSVPIPDEGQKTRATYGLENSAVDSIKKQLSDREKETVATLLASKLAYFSEKKLESNPSKKLEADQLTSDLNLLGFKLLHTQEIDSAGFRAQAWLDAVNKQVIIAYRGTDTGDANNAICNGVADIGIMKYASLGHKDKEGNPINPKQYLAEHQETINKSYIGQPDMQASYAGNFHEKLTSLGKNPENVEFYQKLGIFGMGTTVLGIATFGLPLAASGPVGLLVGSLTYGAHYLGSGNVFDEKGQKYLLDIAMQAQVFQTDVLGKLDKNDNYQVTYTGHSLGGFLAAAMANLDNGQALTFNGPGGFAAFLDVYSQTILGNNPQWYQLGAQWENYRKNKEEFACKKANVTNIVRTSDTVGNVGADLNRTQVDIPAYQTDLKATQTRMKLSMNEVLKSLLQKQKPVNAINEGIDGIVEISQSIPKTSNGFADLAKHTLTEHGIDGIMEDLSSLTWQHIGKTNLTKRRADNESRLKTIFSEDAVKSGDEDLEEENKEVLMTKKDILVEQDVKTQQKQASYYSSWNPWGSAATSHSKIDEDKKKK